MSYKTTGRINASGRDEGAGGDSVSRNIQDKIDELQGKFTLKYRDQKAYYVFSQQQIQENADLIKNLRAEIQEKRILRKKTMNGDQVVITEGFKNDKQSQLAMRRFTIEKAIREKREHVFQKVKALNSVRHEKDKRLKKLKELIDVWINVKKRCNTFADTTDSDQRKRVLTTSIEKMRLKYTSASFIQRTYQKILRHLEEDNRLLPTRLQALEKSIQDNHNELNGDWFQIQLDARKAYENTKFAKERMEEKIIREKRHRDGKLAEVRKHFKKTNQKDEEKLRNRRTVAKGMGEKLTRQPSITFWENIRRFWKIKRSMDVLKESMSLSHATDIAVYFQRQISRKKELEQSVCDLGAMKNLRKKELKKYQSQLAAITQQHNFQVEVSATENAANMNALTEVVERLEKQKSRVTQTKELLADAEHAIRAIHQRISSCDLIPNLIQLTRRTTYRPIETVVRNQATVTEKHNILEVLSDCEVRMLAINRQLVDEDYEVLATDFPAEEAKEILVTVTAHTPFNTRVPIVDEDELVLEDNFFEDDDDNNDQYLARDTIKSTFAEVMGNQIPTKSRPIRHSAKE